MVTYNIFEFFIFQALLLALFILNIHFKRVRTIGEKRLLVSSCMSVSPRETTQLPLYRFSWNLLFEYFSKICREKSSLIKIWQQQQVLRGKTNLYFWSFLAHFLSAWDKIVDNIKTHILCSVTFFFPENRAVYAIMWKNIAVRGRPQMTIWRMRVAYWVPKATNTHSECVLLLFHGNSGCTDAPPCYVTFSVLL